MYLHDIAAAAAALPMTLAAPTNTPQL